MFQRFFVVAHFVRFYCFFFRFFGGFSLKPADALAHGRIVQVAALRKQLDIRVGGLDVPKPVKAFNQCGFNPTLMAAIKKAKCAGQQRAGPCTWLPLCPPLLCLQL